MSMKIKTILLGKRAKPGVLPRLAVYYLLICTGFVFVYPLLFMFSQSMKDTQDLLDPMVSLIPNRIYWDNYIRSLNVLNYFPTLMRTTLKAVIPAVFQTITCGLAGLAVAKYRVPFKNAVIGIVLFTFIIPNQVTMIPQLLLFQQYQMLRAGGGLLPFVVPSLFAAGFNAPIFILIYWQFFRSLPDSYLEAAELDGAGVWKIFFNIVFPMSIPAVVTVFLFSSVWGWNETYVTRIFMGDSAGTLPLALETFTAAFQNKYPMAQGSRMGGTGFVSINESIKMAGTVLIIMPLVIIYAFMQKSFVEAVDRAGITGE